MDYQTRRETQLANQLSSECEALKGSVRELEERLAAKTLELEKSRKQIRELEQLTELMSTTVLATFDDTKTTQALVDIKDKLARFDDYLTENFQLKRELVFEKKRYIDLMGAFMELRDSQKQLENQAIEAPVTTSQCQQMQTTIVALSQEVEYLSSKNIEFLRDLKQKDSFYEIYRQSMDELTKLREAHGQLISMVRNHQLSIEDEDKVLRAYGDEAAKEKAAQSIGPKVKLLESQQMPLSQLLTCGVFSRNRQKQEDYMTDSGFLREKPIHRRRQMKPNFFANQPVNFLEGGR